MAATELAVSSDGGSLNSAGKWYFVWTQVPDGAAYVTFSNSTAATKQAPLKHVSYFTETGLPAQLAADPPIARAYDQRGNQLGEAHVPQWQIDLASNL